MIQSGITQHNTTMNTERLSKELLDASRKGHLGKIIKLIEQSFRLPEGILDVPLQWASRRGYLDVVKYLIEQGANPGADAGQSLRWASYFGHYETLRVLLRNIKYTTCINYEELVYNACQNGHLGIVKLLIESYRVNPSYGNESFLRVACWGGHLNIMKYLIESCGVNPHIEDERPLRVACKKVHLNIVKYLTEETGAKHHESLEWASQKKHHRIVIYLLNSGTTPLEHTSMKEYLPVSPRKRWLIS
jgi:ankyrin repeat protein